MAFRDTVFNTNVHMHVGFSPGFGGLIQLGQPQASVDGLVKHDSCRAWENLESLVQKPEQNGRRPSLFATVEHQEHCTDVRFIFN